VLEFPCFFRGISFCSNAGAPDAGHFAPGKKRRAISLQKSDAAPGWSELADAFAVTNIAGVSVASITIRNLDDALKRKLRLRAAGGHRGADIRGASGRKNIAFRWRRRA
jgi:hypothetical protein